MKASNFHFVDLRFRRAESVHHQKGPRRNADRSDLPEGEDQSGPASSIKGWSDRGAGKNRLGPHL